MSTIAPEARPQRAPRLLRFNATERWLHWAFGIPFLVLLVTGITLGLPQLNVLLAHRDLIRSIHLDSAVAMVGLPVLVCLLGDRRAVRRDLWELDHWDRLDWLWLRTWFWPLRRRSLPSAGRFNAGQKLNTVLLSAATVGFLVTGSLMWKAEAFPLWLGDVSTQWHDLLTIVVLPLVLGHIFLAALNPRSNQALGSIFHGYVDARWAAAHHGRWAAREAPR